MSLKLTLTDLGEYPFPTPPCPLLWKLCPARLLLFLLLVNFLLFFFPPDYNGFCYYSLLNLSQY
jgi:hypothetical protein